MENAKRSIRARLRTEPLCVPAQLLLSTFITHRRRLLIRYCGCLADWLVVGRQSTVFYVLLAADPPFSSHSVFVSLTESRQIDYALIYLAIDSLITRHLEPSRSVCEWNRTVIATSNIATSYYQIYENARALSLSLVSYTDFCFYFFFIFFSYTNTCPVFQYLVRRNWRQCQIEAEIITRRAFRFTSYRFSQIINTATARGWKIRLIRRRYLTLTYNGEYQHAIIYVTLQVSQHLLAPATHYATHFDRRR